ncbi:MAG: T9SS type A sorting domain-containing protein [Bacteroidetes bacterium]|nr:T9SS type A sorting domain-containing protein [Bacteroidota bacterium]
MNLFTKKKGQNVGKLVIAVSAMLALSGKMQAQLSGTKTIPTDYPTLAAAIADINLQGVNGPLTINIPAGFTETAPTGGYALTATGTAVNTITFQKSGAGANPLLTAYTGTATPGSAAQDGVFRLIGSDYVTIDGIDINDPNAANPATMEFGYALYKTNLNDGCQNNTIKNCVITLNRINNASGTSPMVDGSVGINVMNATATAATTALSPTVAAGSNSNNKFYSNTIQNCNIGIAIIGYAASSPFTAADFGNDIGGSSASTGNTILNFGGGATTNPAAGIRTLAQYNFNVSYNVVNNNNGSGVNHGTTLRGIYVNTATSANVTISSNTVTVKSSATTSALTGIENASGSTAASNTVTISNNIISACSYTTSTTGTFTGILQSATPAVTNLLGNTVNGTVMGASGGTSVCIFQGIYNSGSSGTNPVNILNNIVTNNVINNQAGTMYCLRAGTASVTATGNTVNTNSIPLTGGTSSSSVYGFYDGSSPTFENYNNNNIDNLSISGSSTGTSHVIRGIYSNTSSSSLINSNGNNIHSLYFSNSSTGSATVYGITFLLSSTINLSKNKVYDLSAGAAGSSASGLYVGGGTTINVSNNIVGDIKAPAASGSNAVIGINLAGGTNQNVYYNTVNLNAVSTGTLFGTSGIYASTGSTLDLRNNIIVNNSTSVGTGSTVAYRRSSTTLTSYAATSNNNLFYAGTPGANNLIFADGTNSSQTLAAYKTFVSTRDAASITENPTFLSTTGSAANYLHIDGSVASQIESGAANIATYTNDFDGDIRQGNAGYAGTGTSPDIGADEFNGISPAPAINAISMSPSTTQCTASSRLITATVTPGAAALTSVTLNYAYNGVAQSPITMTGGNLSASSAWTGTIPAATPVNAFVTWTVTTTDGTYTKSATGTTYQDAPLTGVTASVVTSSNPICAATTATLSLSVASVTTAPTYTAPPAVTNPTTDEDLGNVTFGPLNNTSAINTLVGTIGTAAGTAGSYADYTAFGPYSISAGKTYTLSVSVLQQATAYSNAVGVYIDYNRNGVFTDAGEAVYLSSATTSGAHTETAVVTVPSGVSLGLTRMRVLVYEGGTVTGPTMTVGYGEYEEYMLNLIPNFTSYSWSDGTTTVGTTNPLVVSPTVTTNYTAVLTDANGCTINTPAKTLSVTPLPSAPTATNNSQCGVGVPVAQVGGGTSYNWYATPTSTTVLQAGTSTTYTTSISSTTTFYVSSLSGTCLSPRTAVTETVSIPDGVIASASSSNLCPGGSSTLTATQTGTTNPYVFSWTATPATGSGMPGTVSGATTVVSPTAPGTFVYSVTATDGICTTTSSTSITMSLPPSITASASPTMICSGNTSTLIANAVQNGTTAIGTGTTTTSSQAITPYSSNYEGSREQYLIRASELQAANLYAGNITSLSFSVTALGSGTSPQNGFTIKIAPTTNSVLSSAYGTPSAPFTTVYGPVSQGLPTLGLYTYNFATPFVWDGVSNILVDICHDNDVTGSGCASCYSSNSTVAYSATSFNSCWGSYADNAQSCGVQASGTISTYTNRPNMILGGRITSGAGGLNWVWNPGGATTNTTNVTPVNSGTAAVTNVYTVTATNTVTSCSSTATVSLVVNPLPTAPVAFNASQCGIGAPTASVSGGTSYNWYATPTSTTVLQAGTSPTYTSSISSTTTFYVSSYNGTCESPRTAVTETVNIPDGVTANSSVTQVCVGGSYSLTAVKTGTTNNYTYTWNATPATGSGITASAPGATVVANPTIPGTYVYVVTAADAVCTTTAAVTVTVNSLPNISNVTATPSVICSGATVNLNAASINAVAGTATVGTQATTDLTGGPFRSGAGSDNRVQYVYTAADLTAAGIAPGNITALSFSVTSLGSGSMNNWTLKIGATTASTLGTTFDASPLTTVFGPTAYTAVNGLNTFTFSTPYNWNGTSNIIVQVCHDATSSGSSYVSMASAANTSMYTLVSGACSQATGTAYSTYRPVIWLNAPVGTAVTNSMNWMWNPGAIPTNTAVVTPVNTGSTSAVQNYTVVATNSVTGCSNSAVASVTVNPLPANPTVFNSTQCGVAVPTASVSGGTSYNWYATPTSTAVLQAGSSSTYTSSISSTTTWYVSSFNGTCESPRVAVTETVTIPDGVSAAVSSASACPNTSVTLTATKTGTANTYNYAWTAAPVSGSGIPTTVSGASVSVTPTLPGTYVYTVTATDAGCTAVATTSLFVYQAMTNHPPVTATPNPICAGATTTLNAVIPSSVTVGDGSTTLGVYSTGGGLSPYSQYYEGQRTQYLYKAAELTAAGLTAGNIGSIAFNVTDAQATLGFTNYTVKMFNTTATDLSAAYATASGPSTTVFGPAVLPAPVIGMNNINFTTPFNWDGASDIIIDICFENDPSSTGTFFTYNDVVSSSTQTYVATRGNYQDNSSLCGTLGGLLATSNDRPDIQFVKINSFTYSWSNGSAVVATTNPAAITPSVTATYTLTMTDANGCVSTSAPKTVTVNPIPVVNATPSSTAICAGNSATITASGATTYTWSPAAGSTATAVVTPTANTTYTVSGSTAGCIGTNTVSLVVNPNPTVTATTSNSVICAGSSATLTAAGATNYTWMPTGGMAANEVVTPTVSTTYTVTGESLGCSVTSTVDVTVNDVPSMTLSPVSQTICTGVTATITASGATTYAWDNGDVTASTAVTPTTNTTYTVVGTNSCGSTTTTATVFVTSVPVVNVTSNASLICAGQSASLTATGSSSYSWAPGGEITSVIVVTPTVNTTYTVTGTSSCGTATAAITQSVSLCTGIQNLAVTDVDVYPNPNRGQVTVTIPSEMAGNATIEVYDAIGKLVIRENLTSDVTHLNTSRLEEGLYIYKIFENAKVVKIGRMIRQ